MSNYLKSFLFSFLVLMVPYMNSASKAMYGEDYDASTAYVRKVNFIPEDQKDVQSSAKQSATSQDENLANSQTSWASYLLSPAKRMAQTAYNIVDYTVRNPKKAMFIGCCAALPTMATTAELCVCRCYVNPPGRVGVLPGCWRHSRLLYNRMP